MAKVKVAVPTVPGRWYVNRFGESHARLVVDLTWSQWGKPMIRVRQPWSGKAADDRVRVADSKLTPSEWKGWMASGQVMPEGWTPSWWPTVVLGPSCGK